MQGTLIDSIKWARPTFFFAVPRVWEKFEIALRSYLSSEKGLVKSISTWALNKGLEGSKNLASKDQPPLMSGLADYMRINHLKKILGLHKSRF
jgi:long-subunit acyl-CoA synthetase (AMP-forming)